MDVGLFWPEINERFLKYTGAYANEYTHKEKRGTNDVKVFFPFLLFSDLFYHLRMFGNGMNGMVPYISILFSITAAIIKYSNNRLNLRASKQKTL